MSVKCTRVRKMSDISDNGADALTLLNDIRAKLKGNYLVSLPGLAIGSTAQNVSNVAFNFQVSGIQYPKAAIAAGTALAGDTIPQNLFGAFRLEIGADGTVDIVKAADNVTGYASAALALTGLPDLSDAHVEMGTVSVVNTSAAFIPGTTALDAVGVTAVYTDGGTAFEAIGDAVS